MGKQLEVHRINDDVEAMHRRLALVRGEILRVRRELQGSWGNPHANTGFVAMKKAQLDKYLSDERAIEKQIAHAQEQASRASR